MTLWDVLRYLAALSAFVTSWARRRSMPPANILDGVWCFEEPGRVCVRLQAPVVFEIRRRGGIDGRLGQSSHVRAPQVGDEGLDPEVEIRRTDPAPSSELMNTAAVMTTVKQLFGNGYQLIAGDGKALWLEGKTEATEEDIRLLLALGRAVEGLEWRAPAVLVLSDVWAAAVEAVILALAAYGAGTWVEWMLGGIIGRGDLHIQGDGVLVWGLVVAVFVVGPLLALAVKFLDRSPRGRRALARRHAGPLVSCCLPQASPFRI